MAVVSLPLQFQNSFWSQDYRKGLEVLYSKLEQVRLITPVVLKQRSSWGLAGYCRERRDCRVHSGTYMGAALYSCSDHPLDTSCC